MPMVPGIGAGKSWCFLKKTWGFSLGHHDDSVGFSFDRCFVVAQVLAGSWYLPKRGDVSGTASTTKDKMKSWNHGKSLSD